MEAHIRDWLDLVLRWAHIISAIAWIGSSFFFMWLDKTITPPEPPREGVKGALWMVHSGGFYNVEKRLIGPGQMPRVLHWFKYEALFTWITGFTLLCVFYYWGSGIYLLDPSKSSITQTQAVLLGIGLLPAAWIVYDLLWKSPLGRQVGVASLISFAGAVGIAYGLTRVLSGRAAFLHVGATFGTLMVMNVWMRILPAQRQMIAATERGEQPDLTLGEQAKRRSVHNNYMTLPVVFIMISHHFPATYGHTHAWAVLAGMMLAGAGVRHVLNVGIRRRVAMPLLGASIAGVVVLMVVTAPKTGKGRKKTTAAATTSTTTTTTTTTTALRPIDTSTVGRVTGMVTLTSTPPAPKELELPAGCSQAHDGPVLSNEVLADGGRLANVFVWIKSGWEGWQVPPAPAAEIVIDQKGCIYHPRVVGARIDQKVTFLNSDPLLHNVHAVPEENDEFNLAMQADERLSRTFSTPEIMVKMKCDVHPWMAAWIGVVPHPWFAVTAADGSFTIPNLPPGDYVLETWHEVYRTKELKLTVPPSGEARADVAY